MNTNFDIIQQNLRNRKYRYIGSGSGRMVYDMQNGYVVKVAKNRKGYAQNEIEDEIYRKDSSRIFAPVRDVSSNYKYLIMQKGERMHSFHDLLYFYHVDSFDQLFSLPSFQSIIQRYHLVSADLERMSSWGLINGIPVIIDYGFTKEVRREYYRH